MGDRVELECHMTGSMPMKVTWSKDHKDIRTGGNYKISCVENTAHLTILKADKNDSGRYSCHATNDMGKDSCSAEVTVQGIPFNGFCVMVAAYFCCSFDNSSTAFLMLCNILKRTAVFFFSFFFLWSSFNV